MQRAAAGRDAHYVVKLAQGSRSTDLCLTDSAQLVVRVREAPGGDRVAQSYVAEPLLFRGRKFDLRVRAPGPGCTCACRPGFCCEMTPEQRGWFQGGLLRPR